MSRADLASGKAQDKAQPSQPNQQKLSREETQAPPRKRSKELAADPNYPTEEIIQALAEMLARHWYS